MLKQRDYPAACKKLEASQRIDPGIGTLLYLADCYEKSGRTASAWATFREAASMAQEAGQQDRARAGLDRAERLMPQLSKLTIELSGSDAELDGVEVHYLQAESGDRAMASAAVGTAVPVDPGTYTVKVMAPGYQTYEGQVTVGGNAASEKHVVPPLVAASGEAAPAAAGPTPTEEPATPGDEAPSENNWQKPTGIALAGAGVVGIALGAVFGLVAMDQNNRAIDGGCDNDGCNSADGSELTDQALTSATVSTVAFAVGGVLLAGGAVLYFTAPKNTGPKKKSGTARVVDFEFAGARSGSLGGAHSPPSGARPPALFVAPTFGGARIGFGGSF